MRTVRQVHPHPPDPTRHGPAGPRVPVPNAGRGGPAPQTQWTPATASAGSRAPLPVRFRRRRGPARPVTPPALPRRPAQARTAAPAEPVPGGGPHRPPGGEPAALAHMRRGAFVPAERRSLPPPAAGRTCA
ncbi:hypothetical protein SBRY_40914 [Actinacidiphila bryophytorum]|uniref:Uncharacterized protein n=1 Tax=Actinacidiphila bryophytorum TaxID=1436133 RepID=A0A9W4H417_9ACTN|nr:hypothetical protein SBRY_40914 [Actinacidiphila bryophytorum]